MTVSAIKEEAIPQKVVSYLPKHSPATEFSGCATLPGPFSELCKPRRSAAYYKVQYFAEYKFEDRAASTAGIKCELLWLPSPKKGYWLLEENVLMLGA